METIRIKLKKSPIGRMENHKRTVKALGFKRVGQIIDKEDTPQIRGMINNISFMVEVLD